MTEQLSLSEKREFCSNSVFRLKLQHCFFLGSLAYLFVLQILYFPDSSMGFPDGSDGKESTCNAGDLSSILCWEDPLVKGKATHSIILARESHGQRSLAGYSQWGHKESDTTEGLTLSLSLFHSQLTML